MKLPPRPQAPMSNVLDLPVATGRQPEVISSADLHRETHAAMVCRGWRQTPPADGRRAGHLPRVAGKFTRIRHANQRASSFGSLFLMIARRCIPPAAPLRTESLAHPALPSASMVEHWPAPIQPSEMEVGPDGQFHTCRSCPRDADQSRARAGRTSIRPMAAEIVRCLFFQPGMLHADPEFPAAGGEHR